MRIATINVPKGCKEIFVDIEESGKLIVSYGSSINRKEFFCQETDHVEEVPGVGDFAILWNKGARERAVVANIEKMSQMGLMVVGSHLQITTTTVPSSSEITNNT